MIKESCRGGMAISEIARITGHDRKTARAILKGPLSQPAQKRKPRAKKLDPFVPYLERRIGEGVLNCSKLADELRRQRYEGGKSLVKNFVQPYREAARQEATVRFETAPGEQAQVDWGHFGYIDDHGRRRKLYGFMMTLGWSRASYLEFTVSADGAWWLRCHVHAFRYFRGTPRVALHDNLKIAVLERGAEGTIRWNPRYLDFTHYCGFVPQACRPYRAQTKGKVE
jgi:transposase